MSKFTKITVLFLIAIVIAISTTVFATEFFFCDSPSIAYAAADSEDEPITTGSCGESATWTYYEDTSTLEISGSGSVNTYNVGATPWYSYADNIKKIIVSNEITSISSALFSGMSALEELTIPFVGSSRDATYKQAVLGYLFDGYQITSFGTRYDLDNQQITDVTLSKTYPSNSFEPYSVGLSSTATWQYSCYDYLQTGSHGYGLYFLQSYYYYIPTTLKKVTVTDANTICSGAFLNCDNISEIRLNENITSFSSYAFSNAKKLEHFDFPNTLERIGSYDFYNCVKLNNIEIPRTVTTIGDYAFRNCKALHTQIGESVKTIGSYAFYGCSSLENQTFPPTLTSIGSGAFKNCTAFTEIHIPQNVMSIGNSAFSGCSSVTTISLEEGLNTIGSDTFCGINKVAKMTIPTTVTSMGMGLFNGMSALEELTIPFVGNDQYISSYAYRHYPLGYMFGSNNYAGSTKVRQYDTEDYLDSSGVYREQESSISTYYIPETLRTVTVTNAKYIFRGAFSYIYSDSSRSSMSASPLNITTIILNEGIERIGSYAFSSYSDYYSDYKNDEKYQHIASNLENINLPSTLTCISDSAFYNCVKLNNVDIPGTVITIDDYAFWNCKAAVINILRNTTDVTVYQHTFTNVFTVKYFDYCSYTNGNNTFYYNVFDENAVLQKTVTTDTDLTLPTTLGGYPLVKVGNMGVANCTSLTSIVIPANILELSDYAFSGCTGLVTVTIPATCLHVGNYAFNGCTSIITTTIAEGVKYVGDYAFFNCKNLQEIVIPDSCEYLGQSAFYNCSGMKSATIGITVPTIEDYTFMNCSSLETIVVGLNVTSIGNYAFKNCTSIGRITLRKGLVSIGDGAFMNCSAISRVTLAATITDIGSYAFYGCSSLGSVTIPAAVTTIRQSTFENCTSLTTASYNGTVEIIENRAFYGTAVSAFEFKNGLARIGSDAFAKTALTNVVLPDSLTVIGQHVFDHCQLTSISMPSCVKLDTNCIRIFENNGKDMVVTIRFVNDTVLDDYLLYNSGAKQVVLENGIEKIGNYTFAKNVFAEIDLPETLTDIGDYAFYLCENLNNVYIPKNTDNIGAYTFAKTFAMSDIYMPDSLQNIGEYAFWKDDSEVLHKVLTVTIYNNCGNICDSLFATQHMQNVVVGDSIKTIGNSVFANCPNLISAVIGNGVESIGNDNFAQCPKLTMVTIGNSVKTIGNRNFVACPKLETIFIGNAVETIGDNNFEECPKLEMVSVPDTVQTFGQNNFLNDNSVTLKIRKVDGTIDDHVYQDNLLFVTTVLIEDGITVIGEYAFYNDTSVQVVSVPNSVNTIGQYAFYNCNSIKEINIPNGVTAIRSHTFFGCASLENIVTPDSVTLIEDYAFYGCVEAKNLTISNNCKSIGDNAFYNCKSITALEIPSSVTKIGSYAFRSCILITELDFSDNVDDIGECAFYDCNALRIVRLGKRVTELKDRMFYGCVNLTDLYVNAPLSFIDELAFYGAEDVTIRCGRDDYMIAFFEENGLNYEIDESLIYEYKVVFKDADGNILSSALYKYGETVTIPVPPQKDSDNTYTYVFKDWGKDVTTVGGNAEYNATYTSIFIEYIVVFKNYDGTLLSSNSYHYGDTIAEPNTPIKPADNTFIYNFIGWDKPIIACNGNIEYTAVFTPEYINYSVIFKDDNGDTLLSKQYHYGDTIELPAIPTKSPDNTFTYVFKSWDKDVESTCIGNVEYIAVYASTYIDYIVKFLNYDGSVLSEKQYHYGDTIVAPKTPQKQADNTYIYNFSGWDNSATVCNGNMTFVALFTPEYIEYKIVFKNYDNAILSESYYHYGDSIVKPTIPTKPSDKIYDYVFDGWNKAVSICKNDETFIAQFVSRYIEYEVIFKNYDGIIISRNTYHYGESIIVPDAPTRQSDQIGSYKFAGWDKDIEVCNGDIDYNATYEITYIKYIVVFKDDNGSELLRAMYHYGDAVVIPTTPVKSADNTYTYSFTAWDNEVSNTCVGNAEYTAMYTATFIEYTVKFLNYDGSIITEENYHYGDTISEPPTPAKAADLTYRYVFNGWNKAVSSCVGDVEYTATFKEEFIIYTIVFTNDDGTILSETEYHYNDTIVVPSTPQKVADPTYTYTFKSWDKDVANNVSCDMVYCAVYDKAFIEYSIRFLDYDGTVLKESNYHYGDTVLSPNDPTRDEYLFKCWSPTLSAVAGDVDYTAMYSKIYTISIDGGAINSSNVAAAIDGEIVTVKANKTVQNKVFKGWSIDGGKTIISQEEEYSFAVTSDLSLVAVYEDEISELSTGAIIGITISAIIVFEIVCFCIIWFGIKKKKLSDLFRKNK